jgi:hypothetical protein
MMIGHEMDQRRRQPVCCRQERLSAFPEKVSVMIPLPDGDAMPPYIRRSAQAIDMANRPKKCFNRQAVT